MVPHVVVERDFPPPSTKTKLLHSSFVDKWISTKEQVLDVVDTIATLFAVVFMVATYLQSLEMMASHDGYVDATSIWIMLICLLACGVIALIHTIFFLVWVVMKLSKPKMADIEKTRNHIVAEEV
ncbi:PGG domain-containing protein [Artemisia annua]|uniref:PGG domain-containing protein n=1 Tax=Artemisia annua TaxID=35608 RepID=A0A2U1L334_ARTAN|nr:PGG domain-containing protein [Artemisia annua]